MIGVLKETGIMAALPRTRSATAVLPVVATALHILLAACGNATKEPGPASTMDAQAFVAVYVDLRLADIHSTRPEEFEAAKQKVLTQHDVTADDLLEFVQRHGRDAEFMAAVWAAIEKRLAEADQPDPEPNR